MLQCLAASSDFNTFVDSEPVAAAIAAPALPAQPLPAHLKDVLAYIRGSKKLTNKAQRKQLGKIRTSLGYPDQQQQDVVEVFGKMMELLEDAALIPPFQVRSAITSFQDCSSCCLRRVCGQPECFSHCAR